jgi:adenylosuccinate lyase
VPKGTADRLRAKKLVLDTARIEEIERTTKHDVIAFLTHVEELAGPDARWLHRGMTSSDVLDTSFAIQLRDATDGLIKRTGALLEALAKRAREHAKTPMIGRSHGIFAEPVTFGLALAGHHAEMARGRERLVRAREQIAVGKIAGAVGTYAHLSPAIEESALKALGLRAETVSTQIVPRDRHAELFCAMALVAAGIERFATNVRHWQRSEVGEAEEAFTVGQKGSSAMPHKRNPVKCEQLCGLARVLRANLQAGLEDVALWHERDISHSSVERIILPDSLLLAHYVVTTFTKVAEGMRVYPARMLENLDASFGLVFSQPVLLALVESGMGRDAAYRIVQRNAMKAWEERRSFHDLLADDPEVTAVLDEKALAGCFDLGRAVANIDRFFDALDAPGGPQPDE